MFNMEDLKKQTKEKMTKTIDVLVKELATVRTGRANANVLDGVKVEYYEPGLLYYLEPME